MKEVGYLSATEIQAKSMSRIIGGQSFIAVSPSSTGKTTTYVLGILSRLKYTNDEAPKVLILVADKERGLAVIEQFRTLSKNKNIRILGLFGPGGMESEINDLVEGTDIVVALPTRARAVYLKLALNLNKIQTFVVDDAELIVKQGMQLPVAELARSVGKVQYLVFTTVLHQKLNNLLTQFMDYPTVIEAFDLKENKTNTYDLSLFEIVNFRTKINLVNNLLEDKETFTKVLIYVNTRLTAKKLAESIYSNYAEEVSLLKPLFFDDLGFDSIEEFVNNEKARVLIIAEELALEPDFNNIPFVFQFEIPEKNEIFLSKIAKDEETELAIILFATDAELIEVRKIEQAIGFKIPVLDLPEDLLIDAPKVNTKKKVKQEESDFGNGAFHEKKASNSKDYNFGIGQKAIMNKKKKHG